MLEILTNWMNGFDLEATITNILKPGIILILIVLAMANNISIA